jgi:hypothetical protein
MVLGGHADMPQLECVPRASKCGAGALGPILRLTHTMDGVRADSARLTRHVTFDPIPQSVRDETMTWSP